MSPPAQPGGPPHGAPPWRCGPRSRLRPRCRVRREGSTPPWHVCQAAVAGLFVSAVTSRGRRHIPLRLQDRLRESAPRERDVHVLPQTLYEVNNIFITYL